MFCLLSATWYPFDFSTPISALRAVFIWLTLLIAIVFAILIIAKNKSRSKVLTVLKNFAVFYAFIVSLIFLTANFISNVSEGTFIPLLFFPLLFLIVSLFLLSLCFLRNANKTKKVICYVCAFISFVATLVCMAIHFGSGDGAGMNGLSNADVNSIALYLSATLFTVFVTMLAFITDKSKNAFDTRAVTYAGVSIAVSFALSYLRIVKMPQGGSITVASLLPIMLYSYMFGAKKGLLIGAVYGLLQAIQDPYIIHPAQFILDYPLAFSCIGLSGIFNNSKRLEKFPVVKFLAGGIIAGAGRFVMHLMSGIFAFGASAGEQNVIIYSLIYQVAYVLPDLAIVLTIGAVAFSSKSLVKLMDEIKLAEAK